MTSDQIRKGSLNYHEVHVEIAAQLADINRNLEKLRLTMLQVQAGKPMTEAANAFLDEMGVTKAATLADRIIAMHEKIDASRRGAGDGQHHSAGTPSGGERGQGGCQGGGRTVV